MRVRHALLIVTASVLLWPSIASGAVTGWTDVVVRVYDANSVIAGTGPKALDLAGQTLAAASIGVIWRVCANVPRATPCEAPMAPGELAIRIVRSHVPEKFHGTVPLGDALIDTRAGIGVLATIYFDRVHWLAGKAGASVEALLGRAIAHELGHLLLATSAHGPVGLMRASWSQAEVRRGRSRDWSFAPPELAAIRKRLEALGQSRSGFQVPGSEFLFTVPVRGSGFEVRGSE